MRIYWFFIWTTWIPFTQGCVGLKLAQWFWRRRYLNFVNVFSLFRNYLPLEKDGGPSFEQTWIPFTQGCFVPSLVEICQVVLEKKIFFNLSMYFCNFVIISPFQKSWILHLNKFEFPFPKDALWQAWLKLAQWFCRRRFFKFVNVILQVRNYLPVEKRKWTFVWTNLNPLRPRMLCAKFGWNWPSGSWEAIQISIFFCKCEDLKC